MRIQVFRSRLRSEVFELEDHIEYGVYNLPNVQASIYCIASLIRKIITRIPQYKSRTFKVFEDAEDFNKSKEDISLKKLIDKILHYEHMSFGCNTVLTISKLESIQIISDFDIEDELYTREVMTKDFMKVAKEIATDHKSVLNSLIYYSIRCIKNALNYYTENPNDRDRHKSYFDAIEATESLIDVFNIARVIKLERHGMIPNSIRENQIQIFFEVYENNNKDSKVIKREIYEMTYDRFIDKLGISMGIILNNDCIEMYKYKSEFGIQGKRVINLKNSIHIVREEIFDELNLYFKRGERLVKCMILSDDLLQLLEILKDTTW